MWHCALPRTCLAEHQKEGYKGKQDLWRESLKTHSERQARGVPGMEKWRDGGTRKWVLNLKPVGTISPFPYAREDISGSAYPWPVNALQYEVMVGW